MAHQPKSAFFIHSFASKYSFFVLCVVQHGILDKHLDIEMIIISSSSGVKILLLWTFSLLNLSLFHMYRYEKSKWLTETGLHKIDAMQQCWNRECGQPIKRNKLYIYKNIVYNSNQLTSCRLIIGDYLTVLAAGYELFIPYLFVVCHQSPCVCALFVIQQVHKGIAMNRAGKYV